MRYYHPFERSGLSYKARVGQPDAVSAAVGQVVLQFAALDAELSAMLRGLLEGDDDWAQLLTAPPTGAAGAGGLGGGRRPPGRRRLHRHGDRGCAGVLPARRRGRQGLSPLGLA